MANPHDTYDAESCFVYESLEGQTPDTIRLLTILPGTCEPIQCTLTNFRMGIVYSGWMGLSLTSGWKALSYMWGTQEREKVISVNQKPFLIRPNLWACLKRMQGSQSNTKIWIDAICVNQDDIEERNRQVLLMFKIYTLADEVIAWLGYDPSTRLLETGRIPPHLKKYDILFWKTWLLEPGLDRREQSSVENSGTSTARDPPSAFRRRLSKALLHVCKYPEITAAEMTAISSLACNAYWSRAWVIQELVHARSPHVWFGAKGDVKLETFLSWLWVTEAQCSDNILAILNYQRGRHETTGNVGYSMRELMTMFQQTRCTDPRDKVYAFLSLAIDAKSVGVQPDYSKSVRDLCADLHRAYRYEPDQHLRACPCRAPRTQDVPAPTRATRTSFAPERRSWRGKSLTTYSDDEQRLLAREGKSRQKVVWDRIVFFFDRY
ncbi:hypothetical protein MMC26_007642 [Xylographa opegraphella]|nr:hypothetical protein [Xylographa opegraphella]